EKAVTSRGIWPPCVGSVVLDKPPACLRASLLAEALLDHRDQAVECHVGMRALDVNDDRVAHRRAEHHQAHDRGAADAVAVLLDLDLRLDLTREFDELGACPCVKPTLVADADLAADRVQAAAS